MHEQLETIHPKEDEQIYAETAAYAHEQPFPHSRELAQDIGGTATAFLGGESVTTYSRGFNNEIREEIEHTPKDYVDFLRNMDRETRADIGFLTDKMQSYDEFKSSVDAALTGASEGDEHYLGRGLNGKAFMFERNGEKYAVKTGGVSYRDVRAFNRAKDINGVSHLIAIDLDSRHSVMNLVPGTEAPRLSSEERRNIPKKHISDLIGKAIELHEAGVQIDPKPSNFLYDNEKGFGVIDYGTRENSEWTVEDQVMTLSSMLTFKPYNPNGPAYGTPEYEADMHKGHEEAVALLNPFLDILEDEYPDILKAAARKQAEINADPRRSGSFYSIYTMPTDTSELLAFKERIIRLGLQGEELKVYDYDDLDVID